MPCRRSRRARRRARTGRGRSRRCRACRRPTAGRAGCGRRRARWTPRARSRKPSGEDTQGLGWGRRGKARGTMAESKPGEEIEQRLEHDAAELDERIDRLCDHIGDAKQKARERADEATPLEAATGDFEDEPGPPDDMTRA